MAYNYYPNQYVQYPYRTMEWVEGEVGAKAFQMPVGWPVNTPIALWDSTEKKIFLKSWNQMGMANTMQELTYEIKEQQKLSAVDMSQYVTKADLDELKQEIKNLANNQNNRNRGGQN